MPYIVNNSDGTLQVTIPDQKIDTTSYSLALVGRQVSNYGQYFAQNTLRQLENFAGPNPPSPQNKLVGQLWYDKTEELLRVWDGSKWKRSTGILVGNTDQKPSADLSKGTAYFNTTTNKLEVYNGAEFREASYAGEVTSKYSADSSANSPTHYGAILRTLFLTDTAGVPRPVLAMSYVKTTSNTSAPANRGTTQVGEQYETIMAIFSDEEFDIETNNAVNGTNTPIAGLSTNINFAPELTQPGVGIASARDGRIAGRILQGANYRAEYEASGVTSVTTLFANTIGSPTQPVSTMYVTDIIIDSEINFSSGNVTNDLVIGGDLTLPAGDINASSGIGTFANLVVTANTTLSGVTNINGTINVNGVNTQTLGSDAQKIETFFGDQIDTQTIIIDDTATINNADIANLTVSANAILNGGLEVTSGTVTLANTTVDRFTATGIVQFDSSLNVDGEATFQSDVTVSGSSDIIMGTGILQGATTQLSLIANAGENNSLYVTFADGPSSKQELETHVNLRYNPSTGELSATGFTGWAAQLKTQQKATNASHYLTFVDSNNATATAETFYTDAGIAYNPSTNSLTLTGDLSAVNITASATLTYGTLTDGSISIDSFVDSAAGLASNDTTVPTSLTVKEYVDNANSAMQVYVDAQIDIQDLDFAGDTGGNKSVDLSSEVFTIAGGTNIGTVGTGQTLTVNLDSALTGLTSVAATSYTGTSMSLSGTVSGGSLTDGVTTISGGGYTGVTNITGSGTLDMANVNTTTLKVNGFLETDLIPFVDDTHTLGNTNNKYAQVHATTFYGTATSAQYADLAEIYEADADYEPGTVVKLGGEAEITQTTEHNDTEVFGVISTDPGYLMNSNATGLPVALAGRVPVKVIGKVKKGERLISSDIPGVAWALADEAYDTRAIIGRSLENKDDGDTGTIEAVIGVK